MFVSIKTNLYPEHGRVVAFMHKGKLRVGRVVNTFKEDKTPFYVEEFDSGKKFYPYTQDLVFVGDNSKCVRVRSTIEEV